MLGVSKNFFAQAQSSLTKYLGMLNVRIKPYINQTSLVNAKCALKIFLAVILGVSEVFRKIKKGCVIIPDDNIT